MKKRSSVAFYFNLMIISVSLGVNAVVVAGMRNVAMPLLPAFRIFNSAIEEYVNQSPLSLTIYLIMQILSFVIPTIMIIIYIRPLTEFLKNNSNTKSGSVEERLQSKILKTPIMVAFLGSLGWIIGLFTSNTFFLIMDKNNPARNIIVGNMTALVLAMVTFIFVFYSVEFFIRRHYIGYFFPNHRVTHIKNRLHLDTRTRFFLLFFASGLTPAMIFSVLFLSKYESFYEISLFLIVMVFLLGSSLVVFLMAASEYERQFVNMKTVTENILQNKYDMILPVTSADELGYLAEGINEMSRGLSEKERMYDMFGRVVDPEVRDHLLKGGAEPGGELREVSVLFTDIRGFTGLSERLPADRIVNLLNIYFEKLSFIIKKQNGMVNKFIGDAVMGVFNAPLENADHRNCALNAAAEILMEIESLNAQLALQNLPEIHIGIGLHSGMAVAGTIGSSDRQEYTVIGDVVNLASRLESLNKKLKTDVLFTSQIAESADEQTLMQAFDFEVNRLGRVQVRGKEKPVEIYTLKKTED